MKKIYLPLIAAFLSACSLASTDAQTLQSVQAQATKSMANTSTTSYPVGADTAILAGGCFWCVESDFEKLDGVYEVISGYTGDDMQNPSYRNHGKHVEGAKIIFNPKVVSYEGLLDYYWKHIDPTDNAGQFCDRGHAYIPVIYARPDQLEAAKLSRANIEKTKPFPDPIVVPILAAKTFWDAEDYHQDYYKKNPVNYNRYRNGCGRDRRVEQLWGK